MEIHTNSLVVGILLVCSFPLLLLFVITDIVLTARSRLKEAEQAEKDLQDGIYDRYFSDPKTRLSFRIMGLVSLVFILALLVALLLIIYSAGKATGFGNWAFWLIIVLPFAYGLPAGVLSYYFYPKEGIKQNE